METRKNRCNKEKKITVSFEKNINHEAMKIKMNEGKARKEEIEEKEG